MLEGHDVRISGQDVGRGTFSQRQGWPPLLVVKFIDDSLIVRHAMLVDQKSEKVVVPLNTALTSEGRLELANSQFFQLFLLSAPSPSAYPRPVE